MRPLSLFIATSLDGYIASPDGSVDWLFSDQDYGYTAFYDSVDTVAMGRHTWEQLKAFGDYPYVGKRGVVFSRELGGQSDPNVSFITAPAHQWLTEAKHQPGRTIWLMGGASLVDTCLQHDLIDEFILSIHPVLLGDGLPLFRAGSPRLALELVDSQRFSSGLVQLTYRRNR